MIDDARVNRRVLYPCPVCHRVVYALDDWPIREAGTSRVIRLACGHELSRCLGFEPVEQIELFTVEEAPPAPSTDDKSFLRETITRLHEDLLG